MSKLLYMEEKLQQQGHASAWRLPITANRSGRYNAVNILGVVETNKFIV